jgi:DNA-binding NarL/FixJ family response regulator
MHNDPNLIKAIIDAGASGYILKEDAATIRALADVVHTVAAGGLHFSAKVYQRLQQLTGGTPVLTRRQLEALSLCAAYPGEHYVHFAEKLGIAESTVRNLLSAAYERLEARNQAEAVHKARELGLITPLSAPELGSTPPPQP